MRATLPGCLPGRRAAPPLCGCSGCSAPLAPTPCRPLFLISAPLPPPCPSLCPPSVHPDHLDGVSTYPEWIAASRAAKGDSPWAATLLHRDAFEQPIVALVLSISCVGCFLCLPRVLSASAAFLWCPPAAAPPCSVGPASLSLRSRSDAGCRGKMRVAAERSVAVSAVLLLLPYVCSGTERETKVASISVTRDLRLAQECASRFPLRRSHWSLLRFALCHLLLQPGVSRCFF